MQALDRLPTWGLYLDCPFLGLGNGAFCCLDPAQAYVAGLKADSGGDRLMLTFVLPATPAVAHLSLRLGDGNLAASLESMEGELRATTPVSPRAAPHSQQSPPVRLGSQRAQGDQGAA